MTDQEIFNDWLHNHRPKLMTDDERRVYNDCVEFAKHYHQVKSVDLADVSNFVLLAKPTYKSKSGKIKRGLEFDGNYYAPQNDC